MAFVSAVASLRRTSDDCRVAQSLVAMSVDANFHVNEFLPRSSELPTRLQFEDVGGNNRGSTRLAWTSGASLEVVSYSSLGAPISLIELSQQPDERFVERRLEAKSRLFRFSPNPVWGGHQQVGDVIFQELKRPSLGFSLEYWLAVLAAGIGSNSLNYCIRSIAREAKHTLAGR